ncbi:TetR/AcrR family transcriptional regulator [Streptomyces sp. NBC_00286]|uniref:TetR/AcrR family transcriptional regulator n=1 Tax=Streptomyces sp. NBC_00286 TaxID=2975701 RepID=UPI002E2C4B05|nr:TetR/AcrR family transcriptional regulator [Streptomyces sp. NBC_00286]
MDAMSGKAAGKSGKAAGKSGKAADNGPSSPRGNGRDAIMDAARDVFAERGYFGASIRDIAKRADMSLSALYYYYSGKAQLFHALIEDSLDDYFRHCEKELAQAGDDPAARLAALVRVTVDYRVRRRVESLLTLQELRYLEPEYRNPIIERRHAVSGLFQKAIDDGLAGGVFRTPHPDDARRAVMAMCNAVAQWYDPSGDLGTTELCDRYVRLAFAMLGHGEAPAR